MLQVTKREQRYYKIGNMLSPAGKQKVALGQESIFTKFNFNNCKNIFFLPCR